MIISEKNEYIAKLEARLDKFYSTVVTLASEPKTAEISNEPSEMINDEFK